MEEACSPENICKNLIVDIPRDLHTQIKMRATYRNVSIKAWVLQAILDRIRVEDSIQ